GHRDTSRNRARVIGNIAGRTPDRVRSRLGWLTIVAANTVIDDGTASAWNGRRYLSVLVTGWPLGGILCGRQVEAHGHRWWIRPNARGRHNRAWRNVEQQWR